MMNLNHQATTHFHPMMPMVVLDGIVSLPIVINLLTFLIPHVSVYNDTPSIKLKNLLLSNVIITPSHTCTPPFMLKSMT